MNKKQASAVKSKTPVKDDKKAAAKKNAREESKKRSVSKSPAKKVAKKDKKNSVASAKDKKKKKKEKDITRPKRAAVPYIVYTTEQIPLLKIDPKYKGKGDKPFITKENGEDMKHSDFMGIAAKNWNNLPEKEKEKYNKISEKDKERYQEQLKEWEEKGYFTRPDGSRSDDQVKKSLVETESDEEAE